MKDMVRDYFGSYRINRLAGKKTDGLYFLSWFIAMPVYIGVSGNVNFDREYMIAFMGILWPMGLSCLDTLLRSPGLDKMLYLCPMSKEERKRCIYRTYYFGVGIHMLVSFIGICVLLPFTHCDAFSAVQILLNDSLVAILVSSETGGENGRADKETALQILMIALALISNMIETAVVADELPDLWVKAALFGIFLMVQLPMAVKYGGYVKQRLYDAVYYETWQRRAA